jgi:bla regulator protein BlaR1
MTVSFFVNHLWQSSCFALLAGLLAFMLRRNSPKVRYWVWLSASLKFLIPFALLVSFGSVFPRPARHVAAVPIAALPDILIQVAAPLQSAPGAAVPAHASLRWVPIAMGVVWVIGFFAIALVRCRSWFGVRAALRAGAPIELPIPIPAVIAAHAKEPGIVGFLRPVLVLPAQLLEHLNPTQLEAILMHEMCHVRRRDNLFAAVHMVVEAVFWFNPLVWVIGSRMLEERELACDEEVLRMGCGPADYVEGILKVCRFYLESPLPCISGVTGADVKKRLRAILAGSIAHELTGAKKIALAAIGLAALAVPVLIGVLNAPAIRAQNAPANIPKFEVVSIKPCQNANQVLWRGANSSPGRLSTGCGPLLNDDDAGLIRDAYLAFAGGHLHNSDTTPITGGPSWLRSAFYDINARAEGNPGVEMMMGPMLQTLFEDRFQLKIHRETHEGPVFFLTVASGGLKLHPTAEGSCTPVLTYPPASLQPDQKRCRVMINGGSPAAVDVQGSTLDSFSRTLRIVLDRPVINKTGITGQFDFLVEFSREGTRLAGMPVPPIDGRSPAPDPTGPPSIFTALEEQLGLRLESGRGPVETLVIDHVEKPSQN